MGSTLTHQILSSHGDPDECGTHRRLQSVDLAPVLCWTADLNSPKSERNPGAPGRDAKACANLNMTSFAIEFVTCSSSSFSTAALKLLVGLQLGLQCAAKPCSLTFRPKIDLLAPGGRSRMHVDLIFTILGIRQMPEVLRTLATASGSASRNL